MSENNCALALVPTAGTIAQDMGFFGVELGQNVAAHKFTKLINPIWRGKL
ncbi:hypothetical protein GCM10008927_06910 [Amylibacter ulvae]|uniref:Uncharacterized protein n=1 Tax=Paramylibacter ulvae TaxID=1651968 RepID=A0ABQ3D0F3_9RHOB|nr:hypothetical protein GCM10008927_06910 [Amylibacter ulvae]